MEMHIASALCIIFLVFLWSLSSKLPPLSLLISQIMLSQNHIQIFASEGCLWLVSSRYLELHSQRCYSYLLKCGRCSQVGDASKVVVTGKGMATAVCQEFNDIIVDTRHAGKHLVSFLAVLYRMQ